MVNTKVAEVLDGSFLTYTFNLLRANVLRERKTMSLLLLQDNTENALVIQEVTVTLQQILREKDVLFKTEHTNEIGILLPHSGREESTGFLRRLQDSCECFGDPSQDRCLLASIIEVFHPELTLSNALMMCRDSLSKASETSGIQAVYADSGFERPVTMVKVSLLEADRLFRGFLVMAFERIHLPGIDLQIREFDDGLALFQSGWVNSWHPHLVVMSDVLPKKNGLDVLHELRAMPNEEKFTVLMMTRRNSEEDMIYAYESGTDAYLVKPFNLRLFEAQVKRMLAGIWS